MLGGHPQLVSLLVLSLLIPLSKVSCSIASDCRSSTYFVPLDIHLWTNIITIFLHLNNTFNDDGALSEKTEIQI